MYLIIPNQESQSEWEAEERAEDQSGPISPFQEYARKKSLELLCHFGLNTELSACTSPIDAIPEKTLNLFA